MRGCSVSVLGDKYVGMRFCAMRGCYSVQHATSPHTLRVHQAALRAIVKLTECGTAEQVAAAMDKRANAVVPAVASALAAADTQHIVVAPSGLANVVGKGRERAGAGRATGWCDELEACGGLATVQSLRKHASPEVYNLAVRFISCPVPTWAVLRAAIGITRARLCVRAHHCATGYGDGNMQRCDGEATEAGRRRSVARVVGHPPSHVTFDWRRVPYAGPCVADASASTGSCSCSPSPSGSNWSSSTPSCDWGCCSRHRRW